MHNRRKSHKNKDSTKPISTTSTITALAHLTSVKTIGSPKKMTIPLSSSQTKVMNQITHQNQFTKQKSKVITSPSSTMPKPIITRPKSTNNTVNKPKITASAKITSGISIANQILAKTRVTPSVTSANLIRASLLESNIELKGKSDLTKSINSPVIEEINDQSTQQTSIELDENKMNTIITEHMILKVNDSAIEPNFNSKTSRIRKPSLKVEENEILSEPINFKRQKSVPKTLKSSLSPTLSEEQTNNNNKRKREAELNESLLTVDDSPMTKKILLVADNGTLPPVGIRFDELIVFNYDDFKENSLL